MSTDLVHVDSPTANALALVEPATRLVEQISKTSFVPAAYRGKPDELLAAILTGNELDIGPMQAMAKIHNIEGRAGLSSELARAVVLSKGHQIWIEETSSTRVIVAGARVGAPQRVSRFEWNMDMAKRAGLDGRQNWRKYPQQMLLARATGDLCRAVFADCLAGISYMVEELEDGFDLEEEPDGSIEADEPPPGVPPAPPKDNTRRAPAKKAAAKKQAARKAASRPPRPPEPPLPGDDGYDEPATGEKSTEERRAQMLAIRTREVMGDMDRDDRLALFAASVGHPVESGKDLSSADVDVVLVDLARLDAGEIEWTDGELVEVAVIVEGGEGEPSGTGTEGSVSPPSPDDPWSGVGDEVGWDDETWRRFIKDRGVKLAGVIKESQRLAAELELPKPGTISELAGSEDVSLLALVRSYIEEQAGG